MKHEVTSLNTKKSLAESLKKIMRKKQFSKITVSEIIADCGVNRKTFYYHFEDIYSLLKWTFDNEAIEIVKKFNLIKDYREAIIFIIDYIESNDHIISCAFDAIGREEMRRLFFSDFRSITESIINGAEKNFGVKLDSEYKSFLCLFYVEAMMGILVDLVRHGKGRDREQTIKYVSDTIHFTLKGIMSNN